MKCFSEFLALANMDEESIASIAKSLPIPDALPSQNVYSLLTAFSIFLQTKPGARGGRLAKATVVDYMSQVVDLLRERYPLYLSDSKQIAKIRDKMGSTIQERHLLAGVQTGEAPGCTLSDLRVLVQETAIKGSQLSMAASGELFLHLARIKTSVVQGISIYKAATNWEQCMLHGLGLLFAGASEPSSYVFPLNLEEKAEPKNEPPAKRVRGRPNVFKYINDVITMVCERQAQASAPLPPTLTAGLSSHSLRHGSAAYANALPQLATQWISTRGAWLLDSLTKAFAYAGTTNREDQSVGKVLAGYRDPHLPCLFKNVSGFTDTTLNVDALVLDAALASLLIHLDDVATAVQQEQAATGFTSHYLYRFHKSLDATNTALGARLSLDTCIGWGRQLRTAWQTENFGQLGERSNGNTTVLAAAVTQMLSSVSTMQRTLQKLVAVQESKSASAMAPQASTDAVVEAHSLAGCFYNWYTLELWHTATQKKEQLVRADLKAGVNIMIIAAGREFSRM
ncbi:hypothetical protein PHYSODRAFT_333408 [Phytophthora sojae]|uniref:Uncharacterized protein n=1 Tax=Phytophthora sojae (strain P6497) TaxID=1094619 RepID=G4ZP98_PHYSP|nr:hypothetical protein PHYSODRAFT_333408 [Phytophthora sojae]EGZ15138.1 hypothetical protein PHYSODRAFT_333408 [Phytophthora sojae]|eukprot:XP_009528887.1 hypothetical protein PHYSODRAFT_333408 [Phytophthora sojae]